MQMLNTVQYLKSQQKNPKVKYSNQKYKTYKIKKSNKNGPMRVFIQHYAKSAQILRISPYSIQMRENTAQKKLFYGHFLRSAVQYVFSFIIVLIQNESDRYCTMLYPIYISGGFFLFLMKAKSLSKIRFGSIQKFLSEMCFGSIKY